jgi:DNA-binding SARP family transcriptional activator
MLRLQLIGPMQVFVADSLTPVCIPKGRATTLLALLAAHRDQVVPLDEIDILLWPPGGTPNAAQIVASLVSRLRRVVGPNLEHQGAGYRLNTRGWDVDLDNAERLVRAAERHLYEEAPGLAYPSAKRALQLLETGRPLEDQRSLSAVDDLATVTDALMQRARRAAWTSALALGDAGSARDVSAAAAVASPLDEEAQRALMQAHYELGESNAALAIYSRLQRRLRTELGADPEPLTQSLHLRILRGEPSSDDDVTVTARPEHCRAARRPGSSTSGSERLKSPVDSPLVGRDDLIAELGCTWQTIVSGGSGAVALIGGSDSGKTELLRALGDHVAHTGGAVLAARCTAYERSLPLQPLADAIRHFCATEHYDFIRETARGSEAALVDLVPALADVLGPHLTGIQALGSRQRLEAIQTFMLNLSMHHPVLLGVDDAHLADEETLTALHRLCTDGAHRVLVAVAVPDADCSPVVDALGEYSGRLLLTPLTMQDVHELARIWRVPHAAAAVHALTGGTPGLVNRALRAVAEGADLAQLDEPPSVLVEAVNDHLRAAGDLVVRILTLAAALGRRFRFEELVHLGFSPAEAATGAQHALRRGLLVHDGEVLAFASDLVHAAALRMIPKPIRCDLDRFLSCPDDRRDDHQAVVDLHRGPNRWLLDDLDPAS